MKKLLLICVLPLTLTGCFYQSIDNEHIHKAEKICSNFGGVGHITQHWVNETTVSCSDTKNVYLIR